MVNLATVVTDSARHRPDGLAISCMGMKFTYSMLDAISNQVANGLRAAGIKRGEKVALCCPNLPYFPFVYYGILKAGCAVVPLNVLLNQREMHYHLTDSDSVALIAFEGTPELPIGKAAWGAFNECGTCKHFWSIPLQPGGASTIEGAKTFTDLLGNQPPTFDTEQMDTNDTAVILYTSGTTGKPKGAELTHANILFNALVATGLMDTKADDVALVVLPLFHSYGQTVMMNAGFLVGSALVLLPRFEAGAALKLMQDENVTTFSGVPTMYWDILHHPDLDSFDLEKIKSTLRICGSGGAAMPVEVMRQFEEKFKVKILEGYGLSETSPVASFNRLDRERKPGSIGLPIWGVEMRCVDEDMNDVPVGEPGEIVIRGHNIMKGYYKKPEANEEAFRGGWFHTGDVAKMDEEGYFYIVDRTKDMIIRGGFNVYPRELEEVLVTHPDISLAAVVGIPHEEYGEEIMAFVIPKAGKTLNPDEIVAWGKDQFAKYKYPRHVEVVDQLPLGPTGKILKTELRKMARERQGVSVK